MFCYQILTMKSYQQKIRVTNAIGALLVSSHMSLHSTSCLAAKGRNNLSVPQCFPGAGGLMVLLHRQG